jgi:hypothetical protein
MDGWWRMIEVLDPTRDRDRIEGLRSDPLIEQVDGWITALPELAGLDLPHLTPGTTDAAASVADYYESWPDGRKEASSRYIYFPWRRSLVRLPDADLFLRLRTARNRYLIDDVEQRQWSSALIGIAGLSVGSSVLAACTLTGARRYRLAECDVLGPTNLNRLAGSVCDLGTPKMTLALRRTFEADPYTEIHDFPDGYQPASADDFIGGGAVEPLTVLVEEMDNLALKVEVRVRARAAGVPVVMVTDNGDNVILDVERFDLNGDYPLFHGRAGAIEERIADLNDPLRRVSIASAIVGSAVTPAMRFSLTQVGRTLPSWPQLGTAATLGGAVGALAARLVACKSPLDSGRYRVDLDEVLLGEQARAADRWNELSEAEFLTGLTAVFGA